jgi:hypothetical protein
MIGGLNCCKKRASIKGERLKAANGQGHRTHLGLALRTVTAKKHDLVHSPQGRCQGTPTQWVCKKLAQLSLFDKHHRYDFRMPGQQRYRTEWRAVTVCTVCLDQGSKQ